MMRVKLTKIIKITTLAIVMVSLSILFSACQKEPVSLQTVQEPGTFQVDPVFREFYQHLGGEDLLGPAISLARSEGFATTQFVTAGKMIFDHNAPISSRFRLAPLGLEMDVREPPVSAPQNPEIAYIDGHTLLPEFHRLFEELGASAVGKPLTEPRFNLIRKRYEQYFENLGFYRLEGSPNVYLLAYGEWICKDKCSSRELPGSSIIDIQSTIDPAFMDFVSKHGADFTGFAITDAYLADGGLWQQILENMVLVADTPLNSTQVALSPLSAKLSIMVETPLQRSGAPDRYFYAVDGDKGYEIPLHFWEYIEDHGGIQLFGAPITHYSLLKDNIYHQCFANLCLMYDATTRGLAYIRPEPLGYAYRELYPQPAAQQIPAITPTLAPTDIVTAIGPDPLNTAVPETVEPASPMREISLRVWQRYLVMDQTQGQEIDIWVLENEQPVANKVVELTVITPDGKPQVFQMPPTDPRGQSRLLLPQMEALNGTIVPFKACYQAETDLKVCVADLFVIWDIPSSPE